MQAIRTNIISLDVGGRRIGVARASLIARLPAPLTVVEQSDTVWEDIRQIVENEEAAAVVVGWPRGMSGQVTEQTKVTNDFVTRLKQEVPVPVYTQDEALTSVNAEQELKGRGQDMDKGKIDSLAAAYILEDFLNEHKELPQ